MTPIIQPTPYWSELHEAKHLYDALGRLDRRLRVRWLRLCCEQTNAPGGAARTDVIRSTGDVIAVLDDFYSICGQNGLTLEWATGLAEHMVRGRLIRDYIGQTR